MGGVSFRMSVIGIAVFHAQRHEQPRHHGEVKCHVALIAAAEVGDGVLRPLVRLGQQHAVAILFVDVLAQLAQRVVRLRQVLAIRAFAFEQIRHGVQPQAIDAQVEPEVHGGEHGFADLGIVPVQVRLMGVEAMPVVRLGDGIPRPVRGFEILEDDARVAILLRRVAPDVEVAPAASGSGPSRALKPDVLVRGVIQHQLGDDAQPAPVGLAQEALKIRSVP